MPRLVKIEHALVCEEIRLESGGKTMILGMFGFSPEVKIEVPELAPLMRLAFLFSGPPVEGITGTWNTQLEAGFGAVGEEKHLTFLKMPPSAIEPGKALQFIVQIGNPPLPAFGFYEAVLRQDGTIVGRAQFEFRKAATRPKDVY